MIKSQTLLDFASKNGIYLGGLALYGFNMYSKEDETYNTEVLWIREEKVEKSDCIDTISIGIVVNIPTNDIWKDLIKNSQLNDHDFQKCFLGAVVTLKTDFNTPYREFSFASYYLERETLEKAGLWKDLHEELRDVVNRDQLLEESPWYY